MRKWVNKYMKLPTNAVNESELHKESKDNGLEFSN